MNKKFPSATTLSKPIDAEFPLKSLPTISNPTSEFCNGKDIDLETLMKNGEYPHDFENFHNGRISPPPAVPDTLSSMLSISGNTLHNNHVGGNLVVGIQNNIIASSRNPAALLALIERAKQLAENSPEYRNMLDELQTLLEPRPNREIIGLEKKLHKGNRTDLIDDASYLENRFARRIAQDQLSPSSQALFLHCLSEINTAFCTHIQPLIRQGASNAVIDAAIKSHVIDPIYSELTSVDCSLTTEMVRGMLFFLTGKCHIQWE